jgi:hypothetical protein
MMPLADEVKSIPVFTESAVPVSSGRPLPVGHGSMCSRLTMFLVLPSSGGVFMPTMHLIPAVAALLTPDSA